MPSPQFDGIDDWLWNDWASKFLYKRPKLTIVGLGELSLMMRRLGPVHYAIKASSPYNNIPRGLHKVILFKGRHWEDAWKLCLPDCTFWDVYRVVYDPIRPGFPSNYFAVKPPTLRFVGEEIRYLHGTSK